MSPAFGLFSFLRQERRGQRNPGLTAPPDLKPPPRYPKPRRRRSSGAGQANGSLPELARDPLLRTSRGVRFPTCRLLSEPGLVPGPPPKVLPRGSNP